MFGPRLLSIDLDLVIVDDITPMVLRPEPFVIAHGMAPMWDSNPYSGTMYLLTTGYHRKVWDKFKLGLRKQRLESLHMKLRGLGLNGTDSAWIGHVLGPNQPTWDHEDGLYSFPWDIEAKRLVDPPTGARIVLLHGRNYDPASPRLQRAYPWIAEHWR